MPPRRRGAGGISTRKEPASTLCDLPESVLAQVFKQIKQQERLASLSLVSKRFHSICLSPELVKNVDADISGDAVLSRAQSLLAWVAGHRATVRNLKLAVKAGEGDDRELGAVVAGILSTAAGVATQLKRLTLGASAPLFTTAWLPAMRQLEHADVGSTDKSLTLPQGMSVMTNLGSLELCGNPVTFAAGLQLPRSLTHLVINDSERTMPPQLVALPSLKGLEVAAPYSSTSMDCLSQMSCLTMLALFEPCLLPGSLRAMTQLEALHLDLPGPTPIQGLDAAFRQLQRLTRLVVWGGSLREVPTALAGLAHLQRCLFWSTLEQEGDEHCSLPSGPWQHSLRMLCTHWGILANSASVLAAAGQLEYFSMGDLPASSCAELDSWGVFWDWAATHPPLQRLSFDDIDTDDASQVAFPMPLVDKMLLLWRRCPALSVFRTCTPNFPSFMTTIYEH